MEWYEAYLIVGVTIMLGIELGRGAKFLRTWSDHAFLFLLHLVGAFLAVLAFPAIVIYLFIDSRTKEDDAEEDVRPTPPVSIEK